MKLRRLSLHGFKSFADKTDLEFHEGITAIVGPNGCGKSNISDAVRWVLGEQRASAIRSSRMEDAIFQGTAERRAVNRAEVSLAFSNEDRRLAIPQDELEIRRVVFREGGSEYQMNRTACRLKDILDVFRDTGLGVNASTVIELRMVDAILSDRAEERRQMFEEAAGIGRYKDRRRAAQRRLEAAQADLTRLEDLLAEVESKVRSLARQRGRAQRFAELRSRRLSLEIAVAQAELESVRADLAAASDRLAELERDEPAARAALAAAETELERRRLDAARAARARQELAGRVDAVGRRIADRERELAVADERAAHASRRLAQIDEERQELRSRIAALADEVESLRAERTRRRGEFEAATARVEAATERQQAARADLAEAREVLQTEAAAEEELARRLARTEADMAGARARVAESESRLGRLREERDRLAADLAQLDEQGDLFAGRSRDLGAEAAKLEAERSQATKWLERLRAAEQAAKKAFVEAEDEANRLASRVAALDSLERDHHGYAPAVAAVLGAGDGLDGVLGALADRIRLDPERAALAEATLGALFQAVVVRDPAAAVAVRRWLRESDAEAGALAMVPESAVPRAEALLAELEFAGEPESEPVLLGRRERLDTLRRDARDALARRDAAESKRAERTEAVTAAEVALRDIESRVRAAELELRRAEADEAARAGERERAQRTNLTLEAQLREVAASAEAAEAEAAAAIAAKKSLTSELDARREARRAAAEMQARREAAWESAREEESEAKVAHARAEAALTELDRRHAAAMMAREQAAGRLEALDAEEAEHRRSLAEVDRLRETGAAELETLFGERDALAGRLAELDEGMTVETEAIEALEIELRRLRRAADERAEERHRLELRRAEMEGGRQRVRERLEAEWSRPYEQLVQQAEPREGEPETLRAELSAVTADIERLGPVNMLAVEEHAEESKRLEFLKGQHEDLRQARDDLHSAIRQINRTARQLFMETFEAVKVNFRRTFETLFEGGECDVWLADPEDPLESPIEISASPRGKRTQRIHLLSGGERALTALALLFAIYLVKPSPFCVLDEVDAPLDDVNIGRFVAMLQEFKTETQFILITHNPRTMEAADWIYGVTMEEPGVSRIVGVRLDDLVEAATA